jgi:RNA polymerase sigma-70 factor (ECF subfamily)
VDHEATTDWNGAGPDSISTTLLERVKAQDADAWERFVKLYGPVVYGWCRASGVKPADLADVVQDTFRAVATGVENFRRERPGDTFLGWLWTVTRNRIRDYFRSRQGRPEAQGGTGAQEQIAQIPDQLSDTSLSTIIGPGGLLPRRALELVQAEFEDSTWQAFWRVSVDGRVPADVSKELGISVQAVYQAKYRVLKRLRRELEGLME